MCGRYVSSATADQVAAYFDVDVREAPELGARFNVAPTSSVYAISARRADDDDHVQRVLRALRWGLVPFWAPSPAIGAKMINARAETIAAKPAFRKAITSRRCLIPADGFYEWKVVAGQKAKQPMYIRAADGSPLAFAGVWERWRDGEGETLETCAVITTAANSTMQPVHDRMPVIVGPDDWARWLDPGPADVEDLARLLVPAPADLLTMHPVSTAVNRVSHDGPGLIEPLEPPGGPLDLGL